MGIRIKIIQIHRSFCCLAMGFFLILLSGCAVKPQPFTSQEIKDQVFEKKETLFSFQEPASGKITLYDAMARAITYNLDHQVKQIEEALSRGNLDQARYEMLPRLVTSVGYSQRNNHNGSSSKSLLTNMQSLEVSTSQEKQQFTADIIYVWNMLDFGMGYTRAQQMADEVLISEEWRRKAIQNIFRDVRHAYWKAVRAQKLLPEMDVLLQTVEKALERSRDMEKNRAQNPTKILAYQQELLETVKQLWIIRKELSLAKTELAALMNMDPGANFELDFKDEEKQQAETILPIIALEDFALTHRPEIWIESYKKRVSSKEVRKAMLNMLPGLEINLDAKYDSNVFLFNNSWIQAGLSLSWNVFSLLSGQKALKTAKIQEGLSEKLYMATAMMVLTQVHLAHQSYYLALKEFEIASQLDAVLQKRLWHAQAAKKAQTGSDQDVIRDQVAALSAKMNLGFAYAELQGAIGNIFNTAGMDPLPARIEVNDLKTLAQFIEGHEQGLLGQLQTPSISSEKGKAHKIKTPLEVTKPEKTLQTTEKKPASPAVVSNNLQHKNVLTPVISEDQKIQYQKSYNFFYDLFIKNPQNRNTNYLLGKSAYGMGDYEAAVMSYERILIQEPSAVEIKLEIAQSYAALGSYKLAVEYIDDILAAKAPQNILTQAKNLKEQIQAADVGTL